MNRPRGRRAVKIVSVLLEKRCRSRAEFPKPLLPEIAFCGRSNVGKSSLINALLNRRSLVKVSGTPGKTRTVDFIRVNDSFRFVDLPGYGFARVSRTMREGWKALVESYLGERPSLAAVVWILDIRRGVSDLDWMLYEWLCSRSILMLPVCTKADKVSLSERARQERAVCLRLGPEREPLLFSAKTGLGKDRLWQRIQGALSGWRNRSAGMPTGSGKDGEKQQ